MALVDQLLDDPPAVHAMDLSDDSEIGVWSTDRDCYLLIAENAVPGARTLETGSGLSTVLLAAIGARHTAVTPLQHEADRIIAYCAHHGIDTESLTFEIGYTDEVLPGLPRDPVLDLVLIDGGHGFPTPMLDWYYAGSLLRPGGLLVIDDTQLPAVARLSAFLDRDPRWAIHRRTKHSVAYWRLAEANRREEWVEQLFYRPPAPAILASIPGRALRKARRILSRRSANSAS